MTSDPYKIFLRNGNDLQLIDNNPATRRFFAFGINLYRITYNGLISTFTGQVCHGEDCSHSWKDIDGPVGDIETIRGGRNGLLNDNRVMYYIAYGRIQIAGLAQMIGSNAQALDLDPM
jgi:hypothetical protein